MNQFIHLFSAAMSDGEIKLPRNVPVWPAQCYLKKRAEKFDSALLNWLIIS